SQAAGQGYRRIVLCADDFGMNPAVNAGILSLAGRGRLSATSLLVDGPAARADIPALRASGLQIGLHLNPTESFGQPGLCLPLGALTRTAWLGRSSRRAVRGAAMRSIPAFWACMISRVAFRPTRAGCAAGWQPAATATC